MAYPSVETAYQRFIHAQNVPVESIEGLGWLGEEERHLEKVRVELSRSHNEAQIPARTDLIEALLGLTMKCKRFPTYDDRRLERNGNPRFPSQEALSTLGSHDAQLALLRDFAARNSAWEAAFALLDFDEPDTVSLESTGQTKLDSYHLQGRPAYIDELRLNELRLAVRLPRPRDDSLWVLASEDGLVVGREYPIAELCVIGRGAKCHVRLSKDSVSRSHARIERSDDSVTLVDTSSTNGVLLNGKRVSGQAKLVNGHTIQVSQTVFEVVLTRTGV